MTGKIFVSSEVEATTGTPLLCCVMTHLAEDVLLYMFALGTLQ